VLVSNRGRAWWGAVCRVPLGASFEELGLAKGEEVVGMGLLTKDNLLVIGTRTGQVKRVKAEDVKSSVEASWSTILGLSGDNDGVLFAGTNGDDAQVMFFTSSRAIRFAASDVNPQATPSAKGVTGIKPREGDVLLGGAVVPGGDARWGLVVVSQAGFVKRVPLDEFSVTGRGGQGVVLMDVTKATGPVVAVGAGPLDGGVDLIGDSGKRQRLEEVPVENRAKRGAKLAELSQVTEVRVL
jgi:DNA gyrase subunit A